MLLHRNSLCNILTFSISVAFKYLKGPWSISCSTCHSLMQKGYRQFPLSSQERLVLLETTVGELLIQAVLLKS
jgi:hypothetical protein